MFDAKGDLNVQRINIPSTIVIVGHHPKRTPPIIHHLVSHFPTFELFSVHFNVIWLSWVEKTRPQNHTNLHFKEMLF